MVKMMTGLGLAILLALGSLVHCQREYCEYNLADIKHNLNISGNVNSFTVNCLAARDATHAESISISVFYKQQAGSGDAFVDVRYDFQCVGGTTLVPTPSSYVSNVFNHACTSCNLSAVHPCEERCDELCGSCDENNKCRSCRYLEVYNKHSETTDKSTDLHCGDCGEILGFNETAEGCECHGYLRLRAVHDDTQYLLPGEEFTYRCVDQCITPDVANERHGHQYCDVCGDPMCVRCDNRRHCEECVEGYVPFAENEEGGSEPPRCISEEEHRRIELEHLTNELLEEQEHEEDEREETALLLRILLPIFCILTLLVCVGMSVFTHYWYPYIDEEGKKRSKTKPTEEPEPTVWRPRPTIRLR